MISTADLVENRLKKVNVSNFALVYFESDKTTAIIREEKIVQQNILLEYVEGGDNIRVDVKIYDAIKRTNAIYQALLISLNSKFFLSQCNVFCIFDLNCTYILISRLESRFK